MVIYPVSILTSLTKKKTTKTSFFPLTGSVPGLNTFVSKSPLGGQWDSAAVVGSAFRKTLLGRLTQLRRMTIKKAEYQRIDAFKLWCWRGLENLLDCKDIQPINPKENQSWVFIGSTDAEAEPLILWPPDVKNWLIWKDPDAGKDWRWEEKGMTEDEMARWHHQLDGHEFE